MRKLILILLLAATCFGSFDRSIFPVITREEYRTMSDNIFGIGTGTGQMLYWDGTGWANTTTPPAGDRMSFWDNGSSVVAWLDAGTDLTITTTSLNVDDVFVRRDGTKTLTGNWAVGNFDITGIDDLDVNGNTTLGDNATDTIDIFGITQIGDGGTTNYAQFATDGELTLVGTARVKKHVQGIVVSGRGANAPTSRITEAPFLSWTFAVSDDSHMTLEVPKDMDVTEDAEIIVHWYTTDATAVGDDSANWQAQWNSRAVGETVNAGATTDTSGDALCGAQYAIVETIIETIPGNSIAQGDHLGLDITRIALTAGTNPNPSATSIHVISVEVEYVSNKLGEPL